MDAENRAAQADARALAADTRTVATEARAAASEARVREFNELSAAEARITGVVTPISGAITRLETQVRELEARRQQAFGGIENQLQTLSRETVSLANALRAPQSRGRWGELTLRRVVELAGMSPYCDFDEQETLNGANGRLRPDMVIRMPGGRVLAVDAKTPLAAYQDAANASDDVTRKAALARYSQLVARHVEQLSSKQYWAQIQPSPELVILFLPGDHFLAAALEGNPSLLEEAIAKRVVLASPATLVSTLAGVAYGWRQQQVVENAELIRATASDIYERILVWQEHYSETGGALARAVETYNRSVGSWESRLTPSLRKVREMGAAGGDEPDAPEPVDTAVREPKTLSAGGGI